MAAAPRIPGRVVTWMRWIARAVASLVAGLWLFIGVASAVGGDEPMTWEGGVMTALIVCSTVSVVVAWRWEGIGGALVLLCGAAHSAFAVYTAGRNPGVAIVVAGGPLLLAGVLFLVCWWGSQRGGRGA